MAKVKQSTGKTGDIVIQNITIKTANRKTQDIDNWRNAIKQFENLLNPTRVLLYDLYTDIQLDAQIESTWGKRQDAVLNKELIFVKDGKEDEELMKLLNSPSMRNFIKDLHNAIAWGFTLIQVNSINYDEDQEQYIIDYDLIPRKHVHPERNFECISKDESRANKDILFKEPPLSRYLMWAGEATDMGLFVKAAQYVIYKRGDFGDWAQFAEMFGMPFREGRYEDYDDETRIKLELAMQTYGGCNYGIFPKNAEFKIHETNGTAGSSSLYKDLYAACNAEISKIILGNTLTTEAGDKGTQALGTVHADTEAAKNRSDEKFVLDLLNGKFKAILKLFGFNVQGGSIWFKSPDADWNQLQIKWNVVKGISEKVPISDDYIYEEFDVPKPDDYDAQKKAMESTKQLSSLNFDSLKLFETAAASKTIKQRILDFFV